MPAEHAALLESELIDLINCISDYCPEIVRQQSSTELATTLTPKFIAQLYPCENLSKRLLAKNDVFSYFYNHILCWGYRTLGADKNIQSMEINLNMLTSQNATLASTNFLLIASMQSYLSAILQLDHLFYEHEHSSTLLVPANGTSWPELKKIKNSNIITMDSLVGAEDKSRYVNLRLVINDNWPSIRNKLLEKRTQMYWLLKARPRQLKYICCDILPQLCIHFNIAQKFISKTKPYTLISCRLKRFSECAFARAAKKANLPHVLCNHGNINQKMGKHALGPVDKLCDYIYTWSKDQNKVWEKAFPEIDKRKLLPVGGIQWDVPISKYSNLNSAEARQQMCEKLREENFCLDRKDCWLTFTADAYLKELLPDYLNSLTGVENLFIFIKPRPEEPLEMYTSLIPLDLKHKCCVISGHDGISLHDLLFASDLVSTCLSTTNLDALSLNRTVLRIIHPDIKDDDRTLFLERFGLPVASSLNEFIRHIEAYQKATENPWKEQTEFAARSLIGNFPNGNAGQKILNHLTELQQQNTWTSLSP